jgi:hypothetical protein
MSLSTFIPSVAAVDRDTVRDTDGANGPAVNADAHTNAAEDIPAKAKGTSKMKRMRSNKRSILTK